MMKTIKKITLVVLILVSTFSYAEKRGKSNIAIFSKFAAVEFINVKKGHELFVKDAYGIILHSETINNNGDLSKIFNLKQLKDGQYTVELEKDFEVIIKPFEINNSYVIFNKKKERVVFKPTIRLNNKRLLISQMTLKSKPIDIEIYYDDALIYSEHVDGEKTMNRVYKLSEIETGYYHAVLKIEDRTYVKHFEL